MELKTFISQDISGNVLPMSTCYLYVQGTETLASGLQDASGGSLTNPWTTNAKGEIKFAAPDGTYDLRIVKGALESKIKVQCNDVDKARVADLANAADPAKASGMVWFQQEGVGAIPRPLRDKALEAFYVHDFGAIGDGSSHPLSERFATLAAAKIVYPHAVSLTDEIDWAAIQAAFNAAEDGKTVRFSRAIYRLNRSVLTEKSLHVEAGLAQFLVVENVTPFMFDAPADICQLSADYAAGALSFQLSSIPVTVKPGNFFKIVSNAVDPANRDQGSNAEQYRCGEWGVVDGVSGGALSLKTPLRFTTGVSPTSVEGEEPTIAAYTVSLNSRVVFPTEKTLVWRGGEILFEDGHDTAWTAAAITVRGYCFSEIDISISKGYGPGVNLIGCCMTSVKSVARNLADNTGAGQFGYGVVDSGGFGNRVLLGSFFSRVRHGFTTNALTVAADSTTPYLLMGTGRTQNAEVIGAQAKDTSNSGFDTHQCAQNVQFIGCKVDGAPLGGFGLRGRDVSVIECDAYNVAYPIYAFTEYLAGITNGDHFTAGKDFSTTALVRGMKAEARVRAVFAQNCSKLIIDGLHVVCASSDALVNNINSGVEFRGNNSIVCASIYGIAIPDKQGITSIFTNDNDPLLPYRVVTRIDHGAKLKIDLSSAVSSTEDLSVIHTANSDSFFENDGLIEVRLSNAFSKLLDPAVDTFSGDGLLRWDISGSASSAIQTNFLGLPIRAESFDKTVRYDFTKAADGADILVSRSMPMIVHEGTGGLVQNVFVPDYIANRNIDSAGHYVRFELLVIKTGNGSALFQSLIGDQYHADYAFRTNGASNGYLTIEVFTIADNSQYVVSRWQPGAQEVLDVSNSILKCTSETANLAGHPQLLKFYANVAVGSSIEFKTCRVYSDRLAFGFAS